MSTPQITPKKQVAHDFLLSIRPTLRAFLKRGTPASDARLPPPIHAQYDGFLFQEIIIQKIPPFLKSNFVKLGRISFFLHISAIGFLLIFHLAKSFVVR